MKNLHPTKTILKVITYNIHSGKNLNGKCTFPKIVDFIKEYNPDILALQEINDNKKRGYQITKLYKEIKKNYHFGPQVKIFDGYYGIATFSAFPIIQKQHIQLPSLKEKRGIIQTTLKINNKNIDIFNTHLGLNSKERTAQFSIIQRYIKSTENSFILMGDFNTDKPELSSSLFFDTSLWNYQNSIPTIIKYHKRIDYILVSKDISTIFYRVLPISLSDHYPVVAKIEI